MSNSKNNTTMLKNFRFDFEELVGDYKATGSVSCNERNAIINISGSIYKEGESSVSFNVNALNSKSVYGYNGVEDNSKLSAIGDVVDIITERLEAEIASKFAAEEEEEN